MIDGTVSFVIFEGGAHNSPIIVDNDDSLDRAFDPVDGFLNIFCHFLIQCISISSYTSTKIILYFELPFYSTQLAVAPWGKGSNHLFDPCSGVQDLEIG